MSDELTKLEELAKAATPDLPDALRIPLHELQADTAYLLGRVNSDGVAAIPHVQNSVLNRLSQIETASYHMNASLAEAAARITALEEENKRLREALGPFAMIAKNVPLGWCDGEGFGIYTDGDYLFAKVSVRQLRRADAALEKK